MVGQTIENTAKAIAFAGRDQNDISADAEEFWKYTGEGGRARYRTMATAALAPLPGEPEGIVVWYDPERDINAMRPHKVIDASIGFLETAELGTKLYTSAAPHLSALADAELQSTADSRIAELEQQIANIKASRDLQVTIAAGEEERARKAEAKLAEAVKVIEQPFCVLFLDGRNEHGSHVLPSYPRSFEPVGDDIDDQAEAILVEAERLGFAIGEHVWAEFVDVPDQIGDEGRIELSGYWEFKGINVEMSRVINASTLSKLEGSSHAKA